MPQDKSVQFPEFREEMIDGWRLKKGTFFAPGGARPPGVYVLPDRFRNIFKGSTPAAYVQDKMHLRMQYWHKGSWALNI